MQLILEKSSATRSLVVIVVAGVCKNRVVMPIRFPRFLSGA